MLPLTASVSVRSPAAAGSTNKTSAAAGETVTLTVYPVSGYELSAISVFKTSDATATVSVNDFNGFNSLNGSFTMPDYDVTVYASFTEIPESEPESEPDSDAMIYAIRSLHVTVSQEEANTELDVAYWLRAYLARLFKDKGWDITVQKLTVVNLFPATAGTRTDMPGTNGSFSGAKIFSACAVCRPRCGSQRPARTYVQFILAARSRLSINLSVRYMSYKVYFPHLFV
ncbi:hypothetical protein FACS1894181_09380 [Bacteroidia bacterium]|nr:hypothetical protein FACS1894181_09380 [Bacteroidia bacterium]